MIVDAMTVAAALLTLGIAVFFVLQYQRKE